jgi:hypothetical protein
VPDRRLYAAFFGKCDRHGLRCDRPEVRSTAQAASYFIENAGAAFAPIITGVIADAIDLKTAILLICSGMGFVFLPLSGCHLHHR